MSSGPTWLRYNSSPPAVRDKTLLPNPANPDPLKQHSTGRSHRITGGERAARHLFPYT